MRCPCCHQETTETLLVSLDTNKITIQDHEIQVTSLEAELLSILGPVTPTTVWYGKIIHGLWHYVNEPKDPMETLYATKARLNTKLKPYGIKIKAMYGTGLRLETN